MLEEAGEIRNVVLVHGGFVDASGWAAVYRQLRSQGFRVSVVQNPTTSLADDVRVVRRALAKLDGPAVLVGHSYGGAVITEAGTDPAVAALVYITAFAPDAGESVASLIADPPPGAPVPPILPPEEGFLLLDPEKFPQSFAADVELSLAQFMADSQLPWGVDALQGAITQPAWKTKPTWYLIATEDRMIPPPAQRAMAGRAGATISEVAASHSVYVSQPEAVAQVIATAAGAARQAVTH
jgi:pimeloyl-ACP methyl ester carboxylesterase